MKGQYAGWIPLQAQGMHGKEGTKEFVVLILLCVVPVGAELSIQQP